jgi:hypothetical protein
MAQDAIRYPIPVELTDDTLPRVPQVWVPSMVGGGSFGGTANATGTATEPVGVFAPNGLQAMRLARTDTNQGVYWYAYTGLPPVDFVVPQHGELTVHMWVKLDGAPQISTQFCRPGDGGDGVTPTDVFACPNDGKWHEHSYTVSDALHAVDRTKDQRWRMGFANYSTHFAPATMDIALMVTAPQA